MRLRYCLSVLGAELSHVACQGDEFHPVRSQCIGDGFVKTRRIGMSYGAEVRGWDADPASALQGKGAGVVGDDDADFGVERAVGAGVNDGLEVGSAVRGEDAYGEFWGLCPFQRSPPS